MDRPERDVVAETRLQEGAFPRSYLRHFSEHAHGLLEVVPRAPHDFGQRGVLGLLLDRLVTLQILLERFCCTAPCQRPWFVPTPCSAATCS